jgi:MFS family permease
MIQKIYYGWIIVALAFVSMAFWWGINSSFSVFFVALLDEFSWGRGESAAIMSSAALVYTVMAPMVGVMIDRFGPRKIMVPGIVILVAGLLLCTTINSLGQLYFFYGLFVGTGLTSISMVAFTVIIAQWFEKKRGLANGIASAGMGMGMFLLVPLTQKIISGMGWRGAYMILGLLVAAVVLPLNFFFLKSKPRDLGLNPDGLNCDAEINARSPDCTPGERSQTGSTRLFLRTGKFWALILFTAMSIMSIWILIVHSVRFLVDQGVDKMAAAFMFAMVGVISTIFRIFWGWLSDRIGREPTFTLGISCLILSILSLMLLSQTGFKPLALLFTLLFGMGWGVNSPIVAATAADLFRGKKFGLIYGLVECGIGTAGAFAVWIAGVIFDKTQSYQGAFILGIGSAVLSILFIWVAAPRKVNAVRQLR